MKTFYRYTVCYVYANMCPVKWGEHVTFEADSLYEGEELRREAEERAYGNLPHWRVVSVVVEEVTVKEIERVSF